MTKKEIVFSGVQPSGTPTIGNYIGAMKGFVDLQHDFQAIYSVVNQHAITTPQDPQTLIENTRSLAALYIAMGIDPNLATIFVQSDVPAHTQAQWMIVCQLGVGELERMTQYKDKASRQETVGAGLLTYPPLMVADIILYNARYVPVGEDQKQHIELTRDFVDRFNNRYGSRKQPILVKPEQIFPKTGARIMSLQDPLSKMSKSDDNQRAFVSMLDSPKQIERKIKSAVTDSIGEVNYDKDNQPAVTNLLDVFSSFTGRSIDDLVAEYHSAGYGKFKTDLAQAVISVLEPIQERHAKLIDSSELDDILADGAKKASLIAEETLARMENAVGLNYRLKG